MFETIHFRNFKALRKASLPLGGLTVLLGPNGSGKSTVLQALQAAKARGKIDVGAFRSVGSTEPVGIQLDWRDDEGRLTEARFEWTDTHQAPDCHLYSQAVGEPADLVQLAIDGIRTFALNADRLRAPVKLRPQQELGRDGSGLAGVLDRLRDEWPERFEELNQNLPAWFPEYDRVLFDTLAEGQRAVKLRLALAQGAIPAEHLSDGTILALALMSLTFFGSTPSLLCLEEPEHGMHPRLLRQVREALYRLAYPSAHGGSQPATQVLVTTHSPYLVDEFSGHPEDIVICQKSADGVAFQRLADLPEFDSIVADSPRLGDIWYTGVLGGVPLGA